MKPISANELFKFLFLTFTSILIFGAVHFSVDRIDWLSVFLNIEVSSLLIRRLIFSAGLFLLLLFVLAECVQSRQFFFRNFNYKNILQKSSYCFATASISATLLLISSLLTSPSGGQYTTVSQGNAYAHLANNILNQNYGWTHRRILFPYIASNLNWIFSNYYYSFIFFTLVLGALVFHFLSDKSKEVKKLSLGILTLSFFTSSFYAFQLQFPGYVDVFFIILALLVHFLDLRTNHIIILVILSLATHENSLFILTPIILLKSNKPLIIKTSGIFLLYLLSWIFAAKFNIPQLFAVQLAIDEKNAIQYFIESPKLLAIGVFAAYKLFWLAPLIELFITRSLHILYQRALMLFFPLITLPFAVDTSRLAGYGFIGIMCSIIAVYNSKKRAPIYALGIISFLNLLIPPFYVGLNTGVYIFPGMYEQAGLNLILLKAISAL